VIAGLEKQHRNARKDRAHHVEDDDIFSLKAACDARLLRADETLAQKLLSNV
jgi:hypothetical protein